MCVCVCAWCSPYWTMERAKYQGTPSDLDHSGGTGHRCIDVVEIVVCVLEDSAT